MMLKIRHLALCVLILSFIVSCSDTNNTAMLEELVVSTNYNSSEPSLHNTKDGTLLLSWIETDSLKQSRLVFSKLDGDSWSESNHIAKGNNWFVNWADFPSLSSFGKDNLVAHYLEKSASGTYTYDVKLSISNDNGTTWKTAFTPHTDQTKSEHGFVSKVALNDELFLTAWLDGRQFAYAEKDTTLQKEMTLRAAAIDTNGKMVKEFLIDKRVCDCCQTDIAMTKNGPMLVYRDRSDDEIRDIYFSILSENTWSEPKPVFDDQWNIAGCPVNGPAISSNARTTAVAWFTTENDMVKVKTAFYNEQTSSFHQPILVDFIDPLGRIDIEVLDDDSVLVSWVDAVENQTNIQLQRIYKNGKKSAVFTVSGTSPKRSSGFPRMAVQKNKAYVAWTDANNGQLQVKTAKINLDLLK